MVWEVFSYGRAPFGNLTAVEVGRALESGSRLERPVDCPAPVFSIAESCWALSPDARPSFRELGQRLREEPSSAQERVQRISGVCISSWVVFWVTCPSLRGIAMTSWMKATCRLSPNEPSRKFRGRFRCHLCHRARMRRGLALVLAGVLLCVADPCYPCRCMFAQSAVDCSSLSKLFSKTTSTASSWRRRSSHFT